MDASEYREKYSENDAPGWDAIDRELDKVYKGVEPRHYGTLIKYSLGGQDPPGSVRIVNITMKSAKQVWPEKSTKSRHPILRTYLRL